MEEQTVKYVYEAREYYDEIDNIYAGAEHLFDILEKNKILKHDRKLLADAIQIVVTLRENKA